MQRIGLADQLVLLFKDVFSAPSRIRMNKPNRPEALSWIAALAPLCKTGAPHPVPAGFQTSPWAPVSQPTASRPGQSWRKWLAQGVQLAACLAALYLPSLLGGPATVPWPLVHTPAPPQPPAVSVSVDTEPPRDKPVLGRQEGVGRDSGVEGPPPSVPLPRPPESESQHRWRRVQQHLQDCGLYSQSIDGIPGPKTQEALNTYRSVVRQDATDLLDEAAKNDLSEKECPVGLRRQRPPSQLRPGGDTRHARRPQ